MTEAALQRVATNIRNLDELLGGGLPVGSVTVIAGPPGSGKTILTQQLCFHNASAEQPVLWFNTLSEPTAKTLRYLSSFGFFDATKLEAAVRFVDLGATLRNHGLAAAFDVIMKHVKEERPAIVVIDSFKVFDDLAANPGDLRRFGYEIAVHLMAWEVTALLLGEYAAPEVERNPLFSIIDGMVLMNQRSRDGEEQRVIQIVKMRGTAHSRDAHSFAISDDGIAVFAPRLTIGRSAGAETGGRCRTGISKLDELLGEGIPRGSSVLVSGVAGTGKTVLSLELIYRGALAGEKGIVFSFEETPERLRASARGFGWDLDEQIAKGMIELVFIPQPDIRVEEHMLMMQDRVRAMGAKRVAVDSLSVFLHKLKDAEACREKTFQLASIVQNAGAVGFLVTDVPYGSRTISRFGVEETVVDGVIVLSSTEEAFERQRYVEVYKLRNTAHAKGRHDMTIGAGGIAVFPRYSTTSAMVPAVALDPMKRVATGVPGLDELMGGGLVRGSVTLVSGSSGSGKTTMGMQLVAEGAKHGERGLYVSLEEHEEQLVGAATSLGLSLAALREEGLVHVEYLGGARLRANQLLSVLTDRITETGARRLVLDGASRITADPLAADELREVLYALVTRFRALGVTTWLCIEAGSLLSTEHVTDEHLSAIADNLVMLRYVELDDELQRMMTIVKTRSSAHDAGRHLFDIGPGGARMRRERARRKRPQSSRR